MNRATLPEGWEIKRMPDVVKWGSGGTPKATEKSFYDGGTISWLVIGDLNDGIVTSSTSKITPLGLENSNAKMIPHGTLLVAMYGSIGKLGITGMECCTNQAIAFAKELFGVSVKYMFYFLSMRKSYLISKGKGGTQKNISLTVLNSLDVIVPPLSEQERIVSRIEELFSQLDAAFAELQTVKEKLNVYRQAVLKSAFEGRLTEKWRKKKLQSSKQDLQKIYRSNVVFKDISGDQNEYQLSKPTEWGTIRLGNIFDIEVGGTPQRNVAEYWGKGIPWVSSGEVQFKSINATKEQITTLGLNNSSAKLQPAGTVLLAMIGEGKTRGQAAILNIDAAHNQNIASILVSQTPCCPKYIYYYLYMVYEYTRGVGSGNNQKALNKERVKAIHVPFSSFEEQKKIGQMLDSFFSNLETTNLIVEKTLQQASALRKSILKQAFEGNL